jgi:phage-related protein
MGISAESYQELAYAAGQCGVEMSTMEKAAKKLEGTNLNLDTAINQIMALGTAEERSAKAAQLFGESVAYQLSPLIEQSGEDFDGLIQRANDLGIIMSGDAVKAGVQFGDLMSDLKQSAQALGTSLGSALFPILIDIIQQILTFMPQIQGFMGQIAPVLSQIIGAILPVLFSILEALMPVLMEIIQTILPLAVQLINLLLPIITALLPLIEPIANLLMAILVPLVDLLSNILPPIINIITGIITNQLPSLIVLINFIAETVKNVLNAVISDVQPWILSLISIFEGFATFLNGVFTGNFKMAWEGIVQMLKGFVNTIITYVQGTINAVIQLINTVVDSALTLANLIPGVDINANVGKIPEVKIPMLAEGGVITGEGQAIVGEAGAELLTLPKGATVQPLNNGIDYDKLTQSFVSALRTVAPEFATNVKASVDKDGLVRFLVEENRSNMYMYGRGLFET